MWSKVSDLHTSVCPSVTRPKTLLRQIYFAILQLTLIFFVDGTLDWIMHNTTLLEAVHIDLHRPVVICLLMALTNYHTESIIYYKYIVCLQVFFIILSQVVYVLILLLWNREWFRQVGMSQVFVVKLVSF